MQKLKRSSRAVEVEEEGLRLRSSTRRSVGWRLRSRQKRDALERKWSILAKTPRAAAGRVGGSGSRGRALLSKWPSRGARAFDPRLLIRLQLSYFEGIRGEPRHCDSPNEKSRSDHANMT